MARNLPSRKDIEVTTWFERDRSSVVATDINTGKDIAEWWDEDCQQMFEDGFFVSNKGDAALKESVLDYLESVGLITE